MPPTSSRTPPTSRTPPAKASSPPHTPPTRASGPSRAATTRASGPLRTADPEHRNEVHLVGRLSAASETRELPSGMVITTFRLVVDRPVESPEMAGRKPANASASGGSGTSGSAQRVDTIEVTCWSARTQRSAQAAEPGHLLEVAGSLRRRFFAVGGGRQSRYEVEASMVRRVKGARGRAS